MKRKKMSRRRKLRSLLQDKGQPSFFRTLMKRKSL
jgi:hypothetical protein